MKKSQLTSIIREEIKNVLKEASELKLTNLKVGDKFKLLNDASIRVEGEVIPLKANLVKDIIFTITHVTSKSVSTKIEDPRDVNKMKTLPKRMEVDFVGKYLKYTGSDPSEIVFFITTLNPANKKGTNPLVQKI